MSLYPKKNLFNFQNKKALIRVDFNVPLDENFNVTDVNRIEGAKPTIDKILADGGSVILMSHLGRPKGKEEKYSFVRKVMLVWNFSWMNGVVLNIMLL